MANQNRFTLPEGYVSGKYAVGTVCFSIADTDRKEVLGGADGCRKIAVRMYYPIEPSAAAGKDRARILSDFKKAAIMKAYHLKHFDDALNYADYYEGASVAEGETFPLIMFSIGYNSYVESNTYLLCALASHGYIVASVSHAFEAVANDYEDGSTDLFDSTINKRMYTNTIAAIFNQMRHMKKELRHREALAWFDEFQRKYTPYILGRVPEWERDLLKALEAVKERYAGHIDLSRGVGASGHSLGGCLAYYLCRYHDEFSCGINIDGGLFGDYPEQTMTKPFCQISCAENCNVETRPFVDTDADTYQVVFHDMKHMGFTDAKFYIPIKMLSGKLDSQEMFRHLVYCHLTFFDKYLKGKTLAFTGLPSEKVTYQKIV